VWEGSIHFAVDGGETLVVRDGNIRRLYDLLWRNTHKPGAVHLAALVRAASVQPEYSRSTIGLTSTQTTVLRDALAQLDADQ
jgi:hypothetical protein